MYTSTRRMIGLATICMLFGCGDDLRPIQEISQLVVSVDASQCPAQASARVRAGMGACERVIPPVVERSDGEIRIHLLVESTIDDGDSCIAILLGYEVDVDLGALSPGIYRVVAVSELNTVEQSITVTNCL